MKKILIINAGQSQKNHVFKRISELDYHVTVLNPYILSDIETYVHDWILSDLSDIDACIEKITQAHRIEKFDGILTFWEEDVLLTAQAAKILGLPGIDFELAQEIQNKFSFRKLCQEKDIIYPPFFYLTEETTLLDIEKNMSFPCIVKPVYGACSAFVKKCSSSEEAFIYYKETKESAQFQRETELGNVKDLFLEGFIPGKEVDIDILVQDGEIRYISILDNFHGNNEFFIEIGQQSPSQFYPEAEKDLKKQAIEIIQKIGIQNACLHFEAKIENGTLIPLELNMRMGGDETWYSNKEVYGVDLVEQAVKICCGEKVENYIDTPAKCRVFSEDILANQTGYIKDIKINTSLLSSLGVIHHGVLKKVGDYIGKPPEDFSYLGWYMIQKELFDMEKMNTNEKRIKACFDIKIEE